jgi:hypothetical protein
MERRGNDLDEETRTMHSKKCKGCTEPTKKDSKRAVGKEKQPTTKGTQSQVVNQREILTRSQQIRYNFSDDEEGVHDTDDELQGYLCAFQRIRGDQGQPREEKTSLSPQRN